MESFQNPRKMPRPPELRFLKEDVGPEDYNPGVSHPVIEEIDFKVP